jgi:thiamine monophosphate synthase
MIELTPTITKYNVQLLINKDVDSTLGIDAVHRALATFVRKVSYLPLTGR